MARSPARPLVERRFAPLLGARLERAAGSPIRVFTGHAAVFDVVADLGPFRERIAPGAFTKTLREADVRFLINHDPSRIGARTRSGTLELEEDAVGLAVRAELDTRQSYIADLAVAMDRGDIDQMSFAFRTVRDRFDEDEGGMVRTLEEVQLFDVSAVTFPAYEQTDAALRSAIAGALGLAKASGIDCKEMCVPEAMRVYAASVGMRGGGGVATDDSDWDADAVMAAGSASDDPAAFFRAVSGIERTVGEPDERQHWALPHHRAPGRPANAAAIRNARARFGQTRDLADREAARRHIFETHRLPSEVEESSLDRALNLIIEASPADFRREADPEQVREALEALRAALEGAEPEPGREKHPLHSLAARARKLQLYQLR